MEIILRALQELWRLFSSKVWKPFRDTFIGSIEMLWLAKCMAYVVLWSMKQTTRRILDASGIVLLFSSLHFMLESISTVFHAELFSVTKTVGVQGAVIFVAGWMVFHNLRELRARRRKSVVVTNLAMLLQELGGTDLAVGDANVREQKLNKFVTKASVACMSSFDKKLCVKMSIMLPSDTDGKLRIRFYAEDAGYDTDFALAKGDGAAGKAYENNHAVYVPAVKQRQGITISFPVKKYGLAPNVYSQAKVEPYQSILSVPIPTLNSEIHDVQGILNLDSIKRDAFTSSDVETAHAFASAVGLALDIHKS
ncbi:MAG TPA: GAF domain-containing protein [Pyrinomonadaceae bacterium]|nr:GAF domain-containing protein [Pyrinomonadaceae bacterium]